MKHEGEHVEFENERVKVLRISVAGRETHPVRERRDRVLIWLTDAHEMRTEPDGKREEIHRRAGEVAWRASSLHQLENMSDEHVELIIVELKA
jgi:hypothetical protein